MSLLMFSLITLRPPKMPSNERYRLELIISIFMTLFFIVYKER